MGSLAVLFVVVAIGWVLPYAVMLRDVVYKKTNLTPHLTGSPGLH
jgi:hypothetical protein